MSAEVPADCRFAETHEWVRPDDGVVRVGITAFAQAELGDVVFVELPAAGDRLTRGEAFGVVESTKAVSDLYAPLSGVVTARNEALLDAPERINEDPYGEGWLLELDPDGEGDLLSPAEYRTQIG